MVILTVIAGIGAIQGMLLFLLVALRYRRRENLPLAALLVVYSLRLGTIPLWNVPTMSSYPWLLPVTTPLPFLFGPLLWAYARVLRSGWYGRGPAGGLRDGGSPYAGSRVHVVLPISIFHLLPYFADLVFTSLLASEVVVSDYPAMIAAIFSNTPPTHLLLRNAGKVVVNFVYVVAAIRLAFARADVERSTPHQRLWLRWIVTTPLISLILFAVVALSPNAGSWIIGGTVGPFVLLSAAMAILIYVFSFLILFAPEVPQGSTFKDGRGTNTPDAESSQPQQTGGDRAASPEDRRIADRLESRFAGGAFRDPELSLDKMAAQLGVHPNRLSHAINAVHGTSFPALLHRYRVEYFVARSLEGALKDRPILDLAFDAGFSSKSTFNRVFKEVQGVSPSEFLRQIEERG